jgi:hypothetical protein
MSSSLGRRNTTSGKERDPATQCPDENTIVAFFRGFLTLEEVAWMDAHVDVCRVCRACLATLAHAKRG